MYRLTEFIQFSNFIEIFIRKILFLSNSRDLGSLHSIFDLKKCYTFVGSGDQIQVWKGTILLDLVQNGNKSLIYVFNRG